jgi:hypothetical protein
VNLLTVLTAVVVLIVFAPVTAPAESHYTFTVIAESWSECFPGLCDGEYPGLAINRHGTVAFRGCLGARPDRRCGIYAGRGGPLTLVAGTIGDSALGFADNGPFLGVSHPAINSFGTIAFYGCHKTLGCGLFTSDGKDPALVIGTGALFRIVGSRGLFAPGISSGGELVFEGCLTTGDCGIFGVNRRGQINTIVVGTNLSGTPVMNERGVVAFVAPTGLFTSQRGGPPDFVANIFGADEPSTPSINAGGAVAFASCLTPVGCSPLGVAIFIGRAGERVTALVDAQTFGGRVMAPSIDMDGTIAFYGCRGAILSQLECGIFTGPDPVNDVVVQKNSGLLGVTVEDVCCFGPPFVETVDNLMLKRGRIAFAARLSDGRSVVVRGDPEGADDDADEDVNE